MDKLRRVAVTVLILIQYYIKYTGNCNMMIKEWSNSLFYFFFSFSGIWAGSDDMRAPEATRRPRGIFRPLSEFPEFSSKLESWPFSKSIYDDPIRAAERINVPGYRYLPISRETYGYSPRNIYADRRPGTYWCTRRKSAIFRCQ